MEGKLKIDDLKAAKKEEDKAEHAKLNTELNPAEKAKKEFHEGSHLDGFLLGLFAEEHCR